VKAENERSAKVLESDPRFPKLQAEALKVAESPDRLPDPEFRNGTIYNTWQDEVHVRGILRRTTLSDYLKPHPAWKTVLDYDALAKKDHEKWVQSGIVGLYPGDKSVWRSGESSRLGFDLKRSRSTKPAASSAMSSMMHEREARQTELIPR